MLEYFTYDKRRLNLATRETRAFAGLFSFDSLSLLIGANGSGKTQMLVHAAETLSKGALYGNRGIYSIARDEGGSHISDCSSPPTGYGFVYFTSVPYRRRIRPSARLVDGSKSHRSAMPKGSLAVFTELAGRLGEFDVYLVGEVSYSEHIVRDVIVTNLLHSRAEVVDPELRALIDESYRLTELSLLTVEHEAQLARQADVQEAISHKVQTLLFQALDQKGNFYRIAALASLEQILDRPHERKSLIEFFLSDLEVIRAHVDVSDSTTRFVRRRDTTYRYLKNTGEFGKHTLEGSVNKFQFTISSENMYRDLQIDDTAIGVKWEGLSSGMLALVEQFASLQHGIARLAARKLKRIVLLIDEGDAFLHLNWQRRYIQLLNTFLAPFKEKHGLASLQVIVASHSPLLAADVPSCMVQRLGSEESGASASKTFCAQLDDIVFECFGSNSLGAFAADTIRGITERAQGQRLTPRDCALIDELGDPAIRRAILRIGARHGD